MSRSLLVSVTMCIVIVVLVISLLPYQTCVVVVLIFEQLWMLNQVIAEYSAVCWCVKGVDHLLLEVKQLL